MKPEELRVGLTGGVSTAIPLGKESTVLKRRLYFMVVGVRVYEWGEHAWSAGGSSVHQDQIALNSYMNERGTVLLGDGLVEGCSAVVVLCFYLPRGRLLASLR